MIAYAEANAPIQGEIQGEDVGHTAAFLVSSLARGLPVQQLLCRLRPACYGCRSGQQSP